MFADARNEVASRIREGTTFLAIAMAARNRGAAATSRGLLFVQLYGAYEYAVGASVQAALSYIQTQFLSCNDLKRSLLSLILAPEWGSAKTVGPREVWKARCRLMDRLNDISPLSNLQSAGLFPSDGSHYRRSQLETIWNVFGIAGPIVPQQRLLGRIDELVETRNAVAHGRQTAREVGGRHSDQDMQDRIADTYLIARHVIDRLDTHCSTGGLLR